MRRGRLRTLTSGLLRGRRMLAGGIAGVLLTVALIGFAAIGDSVAKPEGSKAQGGSGKASGKAKNVILLIGDGMGNSEITIARNYEKGAAGRLALDTLSKTGEYTTYSVQEDNPSNPDYVTDSAAAGTAWATGDKTSNGRISTTPATDKDLKTILELAQQKGLRTGDVSTADITDATPAVLASHVNDRGCKGPQDMAQCPQDTN